MPLVTDLEKEEEEILKIIQSMGGSASHGQLINKIMKDLCCSQAEAEAMIRKLQNRGYIQRRGTRWTIKK